MQNRYVADVGDYGKYGLLRNISKSNLALGINWYLAPDESHNADGKHTAYLNNNSDRYFDNELYDILKGIIDNGNRDVHYIHDSGILPERTVYYDRVLDLSKTEDYLERQRIRQSWHLEAMKKLQSCEIVFLDPDNGLQVKSVSLTGIKGNKYIGINELIDYCIHGKSVIFYNHRERKSEEEYLNKFRDLKRDSAFVGYSWLGLKYIRGTIRDYIFIIHPRHFDEIKSLIGEFLNTQWNSVFSLLYI